MPLLKYAKVKDCRTDDVWITMRLRDAGIPIEVDPANLSYTATRKSSSDAAYRNFLKMNNMTTEGALFDYPDAGSTLNAKCAHAIVNESTTFMRIVTVGTDEKRCVGLVSSCESNGMPVTVLGHGQKWKGLHAVSTSRVHEQATSMMGRGSYIVTDMIHLSETMRACEKVLAKLPRDKLIVSSELYPWPIQSFRHIPYFRSKNRSHPNIFPIPGSMLARSEPF